MNWYNNKKINLESIKNQILLLIESKKPNKLPDIKHYLIVIFLYE